MEELVLNAKKLNIDMFQKLVEGRMGALYRIAFNYFKNREEASDAVQDSILVAHKNIKKLKDISNFNSWITTILVNQCRQILRKNWKIKFEEYNEQTVGFNHQCTNEYIDIDLSIDVFTCLQKLDDKYRETIVLKYFGDHSINEIAEILCIPAGTVKSRLNYGLNKLKHFMEVKTDGML